MCNRISEVTIVTSFQPSEAGSDHPPLRWSLLCCFSSLSFDVTLPATCPKAELVLQDFPELTANCEFGEFLLKGCSDNFTSLHQETWWDWGWASLFISADFIIKHLNLEQTSMSWFHYFSTRLDSLFSFSSKMPPRLEPSLNTHLQHPNEPHHPEDLGGLIVGLFLQQCTYSYCGHIHTSLLWSQCGQ